MSDTAYAISEWVTQAEKLAAADTLKGPPAKVMSEYLSIAKSIGEKAIQARNAESDQEQCRTDMLAHLDILVDME